MDPTTPLAQPKRKKRHRPVRLEDIQLERLGGQNVRLEGAGKNGGGGGGEHRNAQASMRHVQNLLSRSDHSENSHIGG